MKRIRAFTSGRNANEYEVTFDSEGGVIDVVNIGLYRNRMTWTHKSGKAMTITARCAVHAAQRKMRDTTAKRGTQMNIVVNGIETTYENETISYDDVAALVAIEERWQPPLPLLSITYHWKGDGDAKREGIISPLSTPIEPAPGMVFNACQTGAA
jgi:hypothetical protein